MRRTRGPTRVPVWSGRRTSGKRSPSFGPMVVKSLGGSSRVLLANGHRAVAGTERGVAANHDGVFHALGRGTALDMHVHRPLCRFRRVGRHPEAVAQTDGPDPHRLADPNAPALA